MSTAARMATERISPTHRADFAREVREGLDRAGQKELPSKYLYDEIGSALFEVICLLPEYGLSRAGERLMQQHSEDLVELLPRPVVVAELGSGTGRKTRWVLEALSQRQDVDYYPIDISRAALQHCELDLGQIESVSIVGFERAYLDGLVEVAARRKPEDHLMVLFLGSTIGNFDRPAGAQFLRQVRQVLFTGVSLLLATDLEKPIPQLIQAYDDPTGVTSAFNKNLLARINRELGADFDLDHFKHRVRFDETERRVEMHLRSKLNQTVRIPAADLVVSFAAGESIWTESSHKYNRDEVVAMGERAGFYCKAQWTDSKWPFAQSLLIAK